MRRLLNNLLNTASFQWNKPPAHLLAQPLLYRHVLIISLSLALLSTALFADTSHGIKLLHSLYRLFIQEPPLSSPEDFTHSDYFSQKPYLDRNNKALLLMIDNTSLTETKDLTSCPRIG